MASPAAFSLDVDHGICRHRRPRPRSPARSSTSWPASACRCPIASP